MQLACLLTPRHAPPSFSVCSALGSSGLQGAWHKAALHPEVGHFKPLLDAHGNVNLQTLTPLSSASAAPHCSPTFSLTFCPILGQNMCCVFKWAEVAGSASPGYCIDEEITWSCGSCRLGDERCSFCWVFALPLGSSWVL